MPLALRCCLAALLLVAGARQAAAWTSPVPDIVVYCQPSLMHALTMIGQQYRSARHVKVHIFEAESASIDGLVAHMARDDVVVSDTATIDQLVSRNLVQKQPRTVLGLDRYVLVAPAGSTIGRDETLRQIVDRHMLVVTDPTSAASFDGHAVLQRIEPAGMQKYPLIGVEDTPAVIYAVLHGTDRVGVVHLSDVRGMPKLMVIAMPPDGVGVVHLSDVRGMPKLMVIAMPPDGQVVPTRIEAAVTQASQSRNAADFVSFLQSPVVQPDLRADGLDEVAP